MKLTPAIISSQAAGVDLQQLKDLNLSKKEINHIEDISICVNLHKLILSHNNLASTDSIAGLQHLQSLTLLNLSGNQLDSFEGVQKLTTLFVLNMSHNDLNRISMHIEKLVNLKALVLNNNKIKVVDYLGGLLELNTIVLSHNRIQELPSFPKLTKLTKLSAAHNELRQIPDLSENGMLKELRLNHNKLLTIPDSLRRCTALDILDLGGNMLREWSDVAPLGSLMHLINLNLQGNPICDKPDYKKKILALVPSLRVLDGERFDPRFLEIKAKRAEHKEVVQKMLQKKEDLEKKKTLKKIKRGEIQAEDVDQEVLADADQFERKKKKTKAEKEEKKARKEEKKKRKEEKAKKSGAGDEDESMASADEEEEEASTDKKSKKSSTKSEKPTKRSRDQEEDDQEATPKKKSTLSSVFKGNGPRPLAALAPADGEAAEEDVEMDEEAKAAKAELNRIRKETRKAAKKEAKKEKMAELLKKKKAARKEMKEPTTLEEDSFLAKPSEAEVKHKKAKIEKVVAAKTKKAEVAEANKGPAIVSATAADVMSMSLSDKPSTHPAAAPAARTAMVSPEDASKARSGVVAVVDKSAQLAKKKKIPKFDISALEETTDAFGGRQVSGWD
ncbi:hypothetical protein EMPS_05802 [Entomortierella parvispora]|uniref:Protein phosphatase 1 regulatory subunit 7 n=1 Tax=Entomortierella parvispora TaxID=205924 RepID=A0A9P3HB48_9FUNG|nr:hypothetical protein EMPS_05802 [Entomortierella parvispora]